MRQKPVIKIITQISGQHLIGTIGKGLIWAETWVLHMKTDYQELAKAVLLGTLLKVIGFKNTRSFTTSYSIAKYWSGQCDNEQRCKLTYLPVIANLPIWTLAWHSWYDCRRWNRARQATMWFPLKTKLRTQTLELNHIICQYYIGNCTFVHIAKMS